MRCAASSPLKSNCTGRRAICIPASSAARWKIRRWPSRRLLAKVRDKNGRVTIPGFYDDVAPLSKFERQQAKRFPISERQLQKLLGVPELFGERGFTRDGTAQRAADV